MNKQPDLFDQQPYGGTPPSQKESETSVAAADELPNAATLRREVYHVIKVSGEHGRTADEIQEITGLLAQTVTPRKRELHLLGLIKNTGRRRPTRSGRMAAIWVVV